MWFPPLPAPGCAEGYARDATEIQNIQIADGDVCRGLSVPIHMVFPRLFTCPTLETTNFKVGKWHGLTVGTEASSLLRALPSSHCPGVCGGGGAVSLCSYGAALSHGSPCHCRLGHVA